MKTNLFSEASMGYTDTTLNMLCSPMKITVFRGIYELFKVEMILKLIKIWF